MNRIDRAAEAACSWGPGRAALVLLLFGLGWLSLVLSVGGDPPIDNVEQLTWVRSLQWGYHKHPPLPTWLIWPAVQIFGLQAWVAAGMGTALHLTALWLWWDLLRRMAGDRLAWIALAGALCIVHHSARLHHYNHNVVMLLASVAAAWCLWRAWHEGRWRWWLGMGLAIGLGLLAKYQMAATVLALLGFVALSLRDSPPDRIRRHRLGLALSLTTAAALLLPHLAWLLAHPANPLSYAADSTLAADLNFASRWTAWGVWLGDLILKSSGAVLVVGGLTAWSAGLAWRRGIAVTGVTTDTSAAAADALARRLALCLFCAPLLLIAAMVLIGGAAVRPHWATTIALWALPWALLAIDRRRWAPAPVGVVLGCVLFVQALLVAQHLRSESAGARAQREARWGQPMAQRWAPAVAEAARRELRGDIRLVIGPDTVASAFALAVEERPYVLLDGRADISPWVPPGLMDRCGVLFVAYEPPGPGVHPIAGAPPGIVWRVARPEDGRGCRGDRKRVDEP